MAAIAMLRELWRLRRMIRVGLVVAILGTLLVSYRVTPGLPPKLETRQYVAGVAQADVLVDSPKSQVVDLGGGSEAEDETETAQIDLIGLSSRARLLASLMPNSPLKDNVAKAAGVRPEHLIVHGPEGEDTAPRASTSTTVSEGDPDASVMSLYVDETLPIITIQADAPDAKTAGRLASSAVTELRKYLRSVASAKRIPDARQLVVEPLGTATPRAIVKGPGTVVAVFVGILILGGWCLAAVLIRRTVDRWTDLARYESALAAEAAAELELVDGQRRRGNRPDPEPDAEPPELWRRPSGEARRARRL